MIALSDKVSKILNKRNISRRRLCMRTGIGRIFFYQNKWKKHHKYTVQAIAEYLGIPANELVEGTHMEQYWEEE